MLLDHPEKPLLVAEMISIGNSRPVRRWWSMNSPMEPLNLLSCGQRTRGEYWTSPTGALNFDPSDNGGQSPNPSIHSDKLDADGHQPESSAVAAKKISRLSTKKTRSGMG